MKIQRTLLGFVFFLAVISARAQVNDGASLNIGFAIGSGEWTGYKNLFSEFNELRPWLTQKADVIPRRYGASIGIGVSSERLILQYNLSGFKTNVHVEGTDSAGNTLDLSYIIKNRGFELMMGTYLVNSEKFRFGIIGGLTINSVVLRSTTESAAERAAATAWRMLFLIPFGQTTSGIQDHFYLGGKVALPIAIGQSKAICIEPFYALSFWKVSVADDRESLNPNNPSTYSKDYFKGGINSWGVRASFCFGL